MMNNDIRQKNDLNGTWQFLPVIGDAQDADRPENSAPWRPLEVPDFWNGGSWFNAFGPFVYRHGFHAGFREAAYPDHHGCGWYRKEIELSPVRKSGQRLFLHFQAVAARAEVWVNGIRIGGHLGAFTPFDLEITPAARDGLNEVLVKVHDLLCFAVPNPNKRPGSSKYRWLIGRGEWRQGCGGIWQAVWLEVRPACFIARIQVKPSLDALRAEVTRNGGNSFAVLRASIWDEAAGALVACQETNANVVEFSRLQVRTWSPQHPNLYRLTTELLGDHGEVLDQVHQQIGFRTFTIEGNHFHLNGKPYFLRGASLPPHGLIPSDRDYIRRFLSLCKKMNIEVIYGSQEPLPAAWLDVCDELGVMAIQMSTFPWFTPPLAQAIQEYREIVDFSASHPSVILWAIGHESAYETHYKDAGHPPEIPTPKDFLEAVAQVVRSLDNTRPIINDTAFPALFAGGDVDGWTCYRGWYNNTIFSWMGVCEKLSPQETAYPQHRVGDRTFEDRHERGTEVCGDRPLIFNEPVAAYTDPVDGHFLQWRYAIRRVGPKPKDPEKYADWCGRCLDYQALLAKEIVEIVRRKRASHSHIAGITPLLLANFFFDPLDTEKIRPKPVALALKNAFAPLLISHECWDRNAFAGRELPMTVHLIHDDLEAPCLRNLRLACVVKDPNGTCLVRREENVDDIKYYENRTVPMPLTLPPCARTGDYEWETTLAGNGVEIARSSMPIFIASDEWSRNSFAWDGRKIGLLDHPGHTAEILRGLGVAYRELSPSNLWDLHGLTCIVIGAGSLNDYACNHNRDNLAKFVADGGRVLCLEQEAPVAKDTGPYAGLPPHYLLDFVPRARFRLIREYPSHNISFYEFDDTVHILRRDHPVFSGIAPGKFARWNGNQALISSYLQGPNPPDPVPPENQTAIRTEGTKRRPLYEIDSGESVFILAACYTGWQDVAVAEVRYGAGCYFFSQIEAVRRYNQDPVATRYLHNLLNYTMNRNS